MSGEYEVIVIGGGHAGCEAALACARLGVKTLLLTISLDSIGFMPCNPSLGGPAKGHLIREVDALGGQMGIIADQTAIQTRLLNVGKGPAVRALRAQADKFVYQRLMKQVVENQENLDVKQLLADELLVRGDRVEGVMAETGERLFAPCVLLATGTYLRSRIIYGEVNYSSGPNGLRCAQKLSASLLRLGLPLMRFKSGTPARVDRRSLDFSRMQIQPGDERARGFSFLREPVRREQVPCWLTYTNQRTHQIIKDNLQRAALYNGQIEGIGPRHCPSVEAKVVRFADKERHQLFIEPEGLLTNEMYVQGMSSSLPADVQLAFLQTIPGLEKAEMMRAGYAIEYDCLDPLQLTASLEHRQINGLFSAGQANGTSGYEEAAAQGLIAGINAARKIKGRPPLVLGRADAYIGVLIDDLVVKGTEEPYRMTTSRAEYRLLLQQDNADIRLTETGRQLGIVDDHRYELFCRKRSLLDSARKELGRTRITPTEENNRFLTACGGTAISGSINLEELLRRPEVRYNTIREKFCLPELTEEEAEQLEARVKYEGYINKQTAQIEKARRLESRNLPPDVNYTSIKALTMEAREKLDKLRPHSLGQAARIAGVSPADINVLLVWLHQREAKEARSERH